MESFVTAPRLSVDEGERRRCWTIRGIDSLRAFSNLVDSSRHTNDQHHEKVIRAAGGTVNHVSSCFTENGP